MCKDQITFQRCMINLRRLVSNSRAFGVLRSSPCQKWHMRVTKIRRKQQTIWFAFNIIRSKEQEAINLVNDVFVFLILLSQDTIVVRYVFSGLNYKHSKVVL